MTTTNPAAPTMDLAQTVQVLKSRGWTDQMIGWLANAGTPENFASMIDDVDEWLSGNFNPAQMNAIRTAGSFQQAQNYIRSQLPANANINPRTHPTPIEGEAPKLPNTPTTGPGSSPGADSSARALIESGLAQYGLGSLAGWAWQRYLQLGLPAGDAWNVIMSEMRDRPEYAARFPAMRTLGQQGRAISEAQYIEYERNATQLLRSYGLPGDFYDQPDDFTNFLVRGVGLPELKSRLDTYQTAAYNSPTEVQDEFLSYYGATPGQYLAYFIDPDRALPLIEKQLSAAQAGGAARRTGYGTLTQQQSEGLAALGLSPETYQAGFNRLSGQREILQGLPGWNWNPIGTDTAIAAQFGGNAQAQQEIENRALDLVAPNKAGGAVASTVKGAVGAGVAR